MSYHESTLYAPSLNAGLTYVLVGLGQSVAGHCDELTGKESSRKRERERRGSVKTRVEEFKQLPLQSHQLSLHRKPPPKCFCEG